MPITNIASIPLPQRVVGPTGAAATLEFIPVAATLVYMNGTTAVST